MVKGIVKSFNTYLGYGFIQIKEDYRDVIVHYSVVRAKGFKNLKPNQNVLVEYTEKDGKLVAEKVVAKKCMAKKN